MTTALVQLSAALRVTAVAVAVGLASPTTVSAQTEAEADTRVEVCPVSERDSVGEMRAVPCVKALPEQVTSTQAAPKTASRVRMQLGRLVRLVERVARVVRVKHVRPGRRVPRAVPAPKVGRPL
ncbi:MAG: hypothetical protein M3303_15690 [Gemmatimonadota bacterium]|nr:hypothetical protein [Gemmatimonadota bacterium]